MFVPLLAFLCCAAYNTKCHATAKPNEQHFRIVGGQQLTTNVPYQISLQLRGPSYLSTVLQHINWLPWCGGAIISSRYVLTAGHCVADYRPAELSVWAGTAQLDGLDGVRLRVHSFEVHFKYVLLNSSDIALIQTSGPFNFRTDRIAAISYSEESIVGGVDCVLTGWGYTHAVQHLRPPNDVQRVALQTITNDECRDAGIRVTASILCTSAAFGKGACAGDSGGPLVHNNQLIGIVAHGTGLCGVGLPDVYTRVSAFADWIQKRISV